MQHNSSKKRKKRIRLRIIKKVFYRNLAVLVLCAAIIIAAFTIDWRTLLQKEQPETAVCEVSSEIHFADGVSAEPDALSVLTAYMDCCYGALGRLEYADTAQFFDVSTASGYRDSLICEKALRSEIALYSSALSDLHALSVKYYLTINSAESRSGGIELEFTEDVEVKFAALAPSSSFSYGIAHTAKIVLVGESYLLSGFDGGGMRTIVSDLFDVKRASDSVSSDSTLLTEIAESLAHSYAQQRESSLELLARYTEQPASFVPAKTAETEYDRNAAVIYANSWYHTRSPEFFAYDTLGGNCNNFVSQCLYAGGIPMDYRGDAQWKHYSSTLNEKSTESGRSTSWTGVSQFYTYAKNNTDFGMAATVDACFFSALNGDVFQVRDADDWSHSVIVTDLIKNAEGVIIDFAVNSNTVDRRNFPISAYPRTELRLIKILGYNEE